MARTIEMNLQKKTTMEPSHVSEPCLQSFIPTKLEWLALYLNATEREERSDGGLHCSLFFTGESPNLISVNICCAGQPPQGGEAVVQDYVRSRVDNLQRLIEGHAKALGILNSLEIVVRLSVPDDARS